MKLKESIFVNTLEINKEVSVINHSFLIEQVYISSKANIYDNKELFKYLKSNKFLIQKKEDDIELINKVVEDNKNKEFNLLRVLLTDLCNLNCKYCKVCHNIDNPIKEPTPLEKIKKAAEDLFSQNNVEKVIHITGGEPLLFYKRITEFIEYVREKYSEKKFNYIIVIGTNGLLLDDEKIKFFKDKKVKIIISLDGRRSSNKMRVTQSGVESFDRVISAIKKLNKSGIEYGISMVVGKYNIDNFEKDVEFVLKDFNPSSFGVNFIKNTELDVQSPYLIDGSEYAEVIYKIHKKYREKGVFFELLARKLFPFVEQEQRLHDCGASNQTTINIDARGNIGACKSFLCLTDKLGEKKIKSIVDKFKFRNPVFNADCHKCFALGVCGNGCAYEGFISDKKDFIDHRACEYMKHFYKYFLIDLFNLNKSKALMSIKEKGFYIPSKSDREKLLGRVIKNKMGLKQCIGHEI